MPTITELYGQFSIVMSRLDRCHNVEITLDASPAEDYGFDSLNMLEAISLLEDSCGVTPDDSSMTIPIVNTMRDLFDFYVELRKLQGTA
jgi:acyl carrier protein